LLGLYIKAGAHAGLQIGREGGKPAILNLEEEVFQYGQYGAGSYNPADGLQLFEQGGGRYYEFHVGYNFS
jgi:hypothetical protein